MAQIIYARSPFIVTIDEVGQNNTKIELSFAKFSDGGFPLNPDYTLTKKVPAVNLTETKYNISPYIREYINLTTPVNDWVDWALVNNAPANEDDYTLVRSYNFYDGNLLSSIFAFGFDGWGYYEDGINPDYRVGTGVNEGTVMLDEGTYYYLIDCTNPTTRPLTDFNYRPPNICIVAGIQWYMKYTNLSTLVETTIDLTTYYNKPQLFKSVLFSSGYVTGYKIEIFDDNDVSRWLGYFKPIREGKYTPLVCDFINKYGAWQRTWFYKASKQNMEVTQDEYKGLDGIFTPFNTNGKQSVTVNTGWVDEAYNENTLKQLMFSEKILLDGKPVKLKTKGVELKKHINDKTINYTIDFDYSFDMLNTISL
jgi:hypothetical protein